MKKSRIVKKLFFEISIYFGVDKIDISKNFIYISKFHKNLEGDIFLMNPHNIEFILHMKTNDMFKVETPKSNTSKKSIIEYELICEDTLRPFSSEIEDLGLYKFVNSEPLRV